MKEVERFDSVLWFATFSVTVAHQTTVSKLLPTFSFLRKKLLCEKAHSVKVEYDGTRPTQNNAEFHMCSTCQGGHAVCKIALFGYRPVRFGHCTPVKLDGSTPYLNDETLQIPSLRVRLSRIPGE